MCISGEVILSVSKCLETLFKCPFVFAQANWHSRITGKAFVSHVTLGNSERKEQPLGNLRVEKLFLF